MPRADSKQHLGTQFYHSQFSNSSYLPDSAASSPQLSQASQSTAQSPTPASTPAPKKKHVCSTCERAFTTSGHLARHSRVHTGERNHKCPFPGCETRCSRQDNLQQHYRIHLSPGSRRTSARSSASKPMSGKKGNNNAPSSTEPSAAHTPLSPPPLETGRIYSHQSTPPDSPPPLAQATLPATASIPSNSSRMQQPSPGRSSSSSSLDTSYPPSDHDLVPAQPQGLSSPLNYNYRTGTTTYQEQSQGPGYTYVHTTPITHPSSGASHGTSFSSYASHDNFSVSPQQTQNGHRDNSSVSISSRHSISHISHPQSSYQSSRTSPPSPASSQSVSSHNSGPPTPNYSVFHDDAHPYHHHPQQQHSQHHGNGMINNHPHQQQHHHPQPHFLPQQNGNHYHSNGHRNGRFNSPPPTLAPIQGERLMRRDDSRHSQNHSTSPYIHAPPVGDYPYHQGMGLGHGAWKGEDGMRKGLGAALV